MKNRVHILILIIILFIVLILSGCQAARKPSPNNIMEEENITGEREITEANKDVIKGEAVADTLVDLTGIDDATVMFWHNKAIVAVNVSEGEEGVISEELRKKIIDTVKTFDAEVSEIDITADKKLFYRLDDIQQAMIRGKQSKTVNQDIEDIIRAIAKKK
ncbi:sporulation lipoprotein, YhcN/YlaJ family [Proteiniborus ethanoligenes]|uniref:Sporulation lipoprotein, YhcN/YlaJ family n=1 Tax=Proteiniborus ethanoligenes TaxID=415015 RepID=A0A1H3JWW1_9FIRM|nr:YhcN/YlaJ family sporulation lipoprotein [Proteiniborus ethanoligenes]TAH62756.1 MAG: hypothetical protein EWM50_05010 [Gottschalkiaceae bacterium]SDY43754.1 sporulation lipoprotein, YhcN/YlaJ family [Proteiniborus ethanoligenes]